MVSTYTILVVDDETNLRLTLAQILKNAGYSVTTAGEGAEALQYMQAGQYDLVFIDLKMPGMDGLTLLREIRRCYPDMPVLILTGHATLDSATEAVRLGARDYLYKPVDPARILERTREILAEQEQPLRRREIVVQIQNLLSELRNIDGQAAAEPAPPTQATGVPSHVLKRGLFAVDLQTRQVRIGSRMVPLTDNAFSYLVTLLRHAPDAVSYQTLVSESQGYQVTRGEAQEMARWWVHQLRKVLEEDPTAPRYIVTVRGTGYRLILHAE